MDIEKATRKAFDATLETRFNAWNGGIDAYDTGWRSTSRSDRRRYAKRKHAKALRRVNKALCMDLDT